MPPPAVLTIRLWFKQRVRRIMQMMLCPSLQCTLLCEQLLMPPPQKKKKRTRTLQLYHNGPECG